MENLHPRNPCNPWLIHLPVATYLAAAVGRSFANVLAKLRYWRAARYSSHIELLHAASWRLNMPATSGVSATRERMNSIPFQCESMGRERLRLSPEKL